LDKEKRSQFIFKLRQRSVLTQKGKNIFLKSTALQSIDCWMTSSVTYICKQVIPLIPSKCKVMKYNTLLFPKVLRRRLWFILFSNSSGTVFEFVVMWRSVPTQKGKNIFRKSTVLQSTHRWMTSSVTYSCKQVIPLIPSKCKAMKYNTLLLPKVLRRRLWFILFSNSSGTVFEFVVTDGDILNFWWFKAMNIGFLKYKGSWRTCTGHMPSLS